MTLSEKVAYIKGLTEGMELEAGKKETRVITEMLELLGEMASDVEDIGGDLTELYDIVEEIDEDLGAVEEDLYEEDGCGCGGEEIYEIDCPNCQDTVVLDEEVLLSGNVVCPGCGEKIEIEIEDCGCGHDHDHED